MGGSASHLYTCFAMFSRICGIHHLERPVREPWQFFDCVWFIFVTFSTVGYGDFRPSDIPGQTFVIVMICCALILLPIEVSMAFCTFNVAEKN